MPRNLWYTAHPSPLQVARSYFKSTQASAPSAFAYSANFLLLFQKTPTVSGKRSLPFYYNLQTGNYFASVTAFTLKDQPTGKNNFLFVLTSVSEYTLVKFIEFVKLFADLNISVNLFKKSFTKLDTLSFPAP